MEEVYYIHPTEYLGKEGENSGFLKKLFAGKGKPRKMNLYRAERRLQGLTQYLKCKPRQFYFPSDENFRFSLAASPYTLLIVDFNKDEGWVVPFGRIKSIQAAEGAKEKVRVVGPQKLEKGKRGSLQFSLPLGVPIDLEIVWGLDEVHQKRADNGGMSVWEWK